MPRIIADGQPAGAGGGVATGDISMAADFSEDISGTTAPVDGTLGSTSVPTLDHDGGGTTTGQQVQFTVPDDYDSGDLTLKISYAMTGSSGLNIVVSTKAEIVKVASGTVDTASYPETNQTVTPPGTADTPVRESFLTIASGKFSGGDTILFQIKRKSGDASDTNTALWQVITYEIAYTGQVATREMTQHIRIFTDTDETPASDGTWGDFGTVDYSGSADNEQAIQFIIPENYDGFSDVQLRINYLMGGTNSGGIVLETEGTIVDISGATTVAIASEKLTFPSPADTSPHRTTVVRAIQGGTVAVGDSVSLKIARRAATDANDTCSDLFRVVDAVIVTGVMPKSQFSQVTVEGHYLYAHDFSVGAGTPSGEQESPTYSAGNFETWMKMTSNGASDQITVSFQGRLMATQAAIKTIKIPMMASHADATLTYSIKVYVEDGSLGTPAYNPGAVQASGTSRFVVELTDGDLSSRQPDFVGGREGRFFVTVTMDVTSASRILRVGRPFVGLE